jgi:hypothetical protein
VSGAAHIALAAVLAAVFVSCGGGGAGGADAISPSAPAPLVVRGAAPEDTSPKADLRMVPPEAYMRTYLQLFGGLAPLDAQRLARGRDGAQLFDTWDDYVSAMGFPDYRLDVPRQTQTNAVMIASFERLGIALCDRALEHDLTGRTGKPPPPVAERLIFAFDLASGDMDLAAFTARFDVMHRTFLGYPVSLAPPARAARFFQLYRDVEADHAQKRERSRFSPAEAGWAAVCYGLVRHPEFHLY